MVHASSRHREIDLSSLVRSICQTLELVNAAIARLRLRCRRPPRLSPPPDFRRLPHMAISLTSGCATALWEMEPTTSNRET